jgi:predicted nucleotide-binding protein
MVDEVKSELVESGYKVVSERRLPNQSGMQLRLATGQTVSIFDTGRLLVQGKESGPIQQLLDEKFSQSARASTPRKVFVVYGHDGQAREELENMLRKWGLEPILIDQLPSEGQTIIEKLEKYRGQSDFAVVLATPDDEGHRASKTDEKAFRARQNVVLELGMMLAHLGRARVAILLKNVGNMERPSDIQGLIYIPFVDSVKEATLQLAKEMNKQGFTLDIGKL